MLPHPDFLHMYKVPGPYACPAGREGQANQGQEKRTNMKDYFPETGFGVLPALAGRRALFHDRYPIGLGWFFRRSEGNHLKTHL